MLFMGKALILVPHFDDELLVGGALLYGFAQTKGWDPYVLYMTNGDYFEYETVTRQEEALLSCKELGIDKDHVIFLGYGDRWAGAKHIYNSDGEIVTSFFGRKETYSVNGYEEYCFKNNKVHNKYTRENLKNDIRQVICELLPEVIVCVGFDAHPDHRALYLLTSEVLPEIIVENNYFPLILWKYAYECVFKGANDYHHIPHLPTQCQSGKLVSSPIHKWDERISFSVGEKCDTTLLKDNILFKAACKHKTQQFKYIAPKAINADIVYWRQYSENLAFFAKVSSSSGKSSFINDGKTIDSKDITIPNCALNGSVWVPDEADEKKCIILRWQKCIQVNQVHIYENPSLDSNINRIRLEFDNGACFYFSEIHHDGSRSCFYCHESGVKKMIITIVDSKGENPGISEIEVYDHIKDLSDYHLPLQLYKNKNVEKKISLITAGMVIVEKWVFKIDELLFQKLFPSHYQLAKRYPEVRNNHKYFLYYIKNIKKRLANYTSRGKEGKIRKE